LWITYALNKLINIKVNFVRSAWSALFEISNASDALLIFAHWIIYLISSCDKIELNDIVSNINDLKCCWCLLEMMIKRISFVASLFFLQMNLLCDRNRCSLMMKIAKVSWVTDFRFWLILRNVKSISIRCSTHAFMI